jgi:hypothetical protein
MSEYEPDESVTAHVLYVSPTINTVYFSLKEHTRDRFYETPFLPKT